MTYGSHKSIFCNEVLSFAKEVEKSKSNNLSYLDLTFGGGGHTRLMLENLKDLSAIAVDQDGDAIENGKSLVKEFSQLQLIHNNFLKYLSEDANQSTFDIILADLGVSSHHFDSPERGFSYKFEAPLDMRMDTSKNSLKASDVVNNESEESLVKIFQAYGEENFSKKIASKIVETRKAELIITTKQLEEIIFYCYPKSLRHKKTHPATKVFQALRIYVNDEINVLRDTVKKAYDMLNDDGLLMFITFHSLEDRVVKEKFKEIVLNESNRGKILTKKPLVPTEEELEYNRRSRSAKLRVIKKLSEESFKSEASRKQKYSVFSKLPK